MASGSTHAIDRALAEMPVDDRIAALVVSLIGSRHESMRTTYSLVSLLGALTAHLPMTDIERVLIAEELRDLGDRIEHAQDQLSACGGEHADAASTALLLRSGIWT